VKRFAIPQEEEDLLIQNRTLRAELGFLLLKLRRLRRELHARVQERKLKPPGPSPKIT
jgi:hypothetical protein